MHLPFHKAPQLCEPGVCPVDYHQEPGLVETREQLPECLNAVVCVSEHGHTPFKLRVSLTTVRSQPGSRAPPEIRSGDRREDAFLDSQRSSQTAGRNVRPRALLVASASAVTQRHSPRLF